MLLDLGVVSQRENESLLYWECRLEGHFFQLRIESYWTNYEYDGCGVMRSQCLSKCYGVSPEHMSIRPELFPLRLAGDE